MLFNIGEKFYNLIINYKLIINCGKFNSWINFLFYKNDYVNEE